MRAVGVHGNGMVSLELFGKIYRACACGEPNPSMVDCPSCGAMNYSGHPCRACGGPGGVPNDHWLTCPSCGCAARVDDVGMLSAWYRNPLRRLAHKMREHVRKLKERHQSRMQRA